MNKWWEDYEGEENVLIDDIGPDCIGAQHIKRWCDKKQFRGEKKYSSVFIRPKKIVITSNYHPKEIWTNPNDYEAICDRVEVICLDTKWQDRIQLATDAPSFIMKPTEPQPTGAGLWENNAKKVFKNSKKRKFDQPLKAKKPFISKDGKIVKNTETQMVVEDAIDNLKVTQEIAKEKEVIELIDSTEEECDMDILENLGCDNCNECGQNIAICDCYDDDDDYINRYNMDSEGEVLFDECSEDLFDI